MNKTNKLRISLIVLTILSFFVTTSCTWKKSRMIKHSFKKEKHTVNVFEKNVNDHYLSKKKLEHPYSFSDAEIYHNLITLYYKRLTLFSREEPVFNKKLAGEIAPLVAAALKKANKNDIIEFDILSPKGRIAGNVFIFNKKLNWKFKTINNASYEKRNSRDYLGGWKLILKKGQKYHGKKELFGTRIEKNWIVYAVKKARPRALHSDKKNLKSSNNAEFSDFESTTRSKTSETHSNKPSAGEPSTSSASEEVEIQFRRLKSLMEKELITKEEYKTRKKELLDKYF